MIKINEYDRIVSFGIMKLDYDDKDFFEEFVNYYDETAQVRAEDIEESYILNKQGVQIKKTNYIKTLFINDVVVVNYLEERSIEFVISEICEELCIDDEIEVVK